jgi:hypothetical protein
VALRQSPDQEEYAVVVVTSKKMKSMKQKEGYLVDKTIHE